ncbi:proto-oncogene FRAT1 isoform X1 [Cricetulus griseus]|uniref:Proto-oncogene FRAT1 n=1 Tax=Cricetulus griseus TaxID=10029 RepID=G3INT8_CRIGR|nr:proto-oncogene FRAT1 isoform X1 [Cricetulus griseus]EGW12134.1 Proto-oncogene FRAT1 [Cricetulus griseus]
MQCQRAEKEEGGFEAEGEDKDDSFLLLQQSVTLGSLTDVDQLIALIGETLKLDTAHDGPASPSAAPGPPPLRVLAAISVEQNRSPSRQMLRSSVPAETGAPAHPRAISCMLWERWRLRSQAAPYCVAELTAVTSALCPVSRQPGLEGPPVTGKPSTPQPLSGPCRRGWPQSTAMSLPLQQRPGSQPETHTSDDDPHQLPQQLLLSGNLIKEAVQRLHSLQLQLQANLYSHRFLKRLSAPV